MGDYQLAINLSCFRRGANIAKKDFLALLSFDADNDVTGKYSSQGVGATSRVQFRPVLLSDFGTADEPTEAPVLLSDFSAADEPTEAYEAAVQERFLSVAAFLDRQEVSVFEGFRATGLHVYIYVGLCMEDDQMQLNLPAAFIASCARLGLGLEIISND